MPPCRCATRSEPPRSRHLRRRQRRVVVGGELAVLVGATAGDVAAIDATGPPGGVSSRRQRRGPEQGPNGIECVELCGRKMKRIFSAPLFGWWITPSRRIGAGCERLSGRRRTLCQALGHEDSTLLATSLPHGRVTRNHHRPKRNRGLVLARLIRCGAYCTGWPTAPPWWWWWWWPTDQSPAIEADVAAFVVLPRRAMSRHRDCGHAMPYTRQPGARKDVVGKVGE